MVASATICIGTLAVAPAVGIMPASYERLPGKLIGPGLEHFTYIQKSPFGQVVNVAKMKKGAPHEVRAVPARGEIGSGLERTSSICQRVGCAVAVNGDFWKPGTGVPIGGVISRGRLLRTPKSDHAQVTLSADGVFRTGPLTLEASLVTDDLAPIVINAVNKQPVGDEVTLYLPAFGPRTATTKGTVEVLLHSRKPKGAVTLDHTTLIRIERDVRTPGNAPIPSEGAVLSAAGKGANTVRDLLARIRGRKTAPEALLRIRSGIAAVESIGASPVLVKDGKIVAPNDPTNFIQGRHPRTLLGWTKAGGVLLATVDGRQPGYSEGMTIAEAARLMIDLGAYDAVNLDGGGSTTFVTRGAVVNRPSDRAVKAGEQQRIVHETNAGPHVVGNVERPVAIALAIVPKTAKAKAAVEAVPVLRELEVTETVDLAVPHAKDVASDPSGALPAIVYYPADENAGLRVAALVVAAIAMMLVAWTTGQRSGAVRARPLAKAKPPSPRGSPPTARAR